jgi:predicted cupin superfamily sugar epimerase
MKMTARQVVDILGLVPHPEEGGHYRETHRSDERHPAHALPDRYADERCHGTAIYYLLTPQTYSHMHRLVSDEVFHFYMGDACEMLMLHPDGSGQVMVLGHDLAAGQRPQVVVPRGSWQGMRLLSGGGFGLMGCTVAPGFEFADYEHGVRAELTAAYPAFAERIAPLTGE